MPVTYYQDILENQGMDKDKWEHLKCRYCKEKFEVIKKNKYEEIKRCPKCGLLYKLVKKSRTEKELKE